MPALNGQGPCSEGAMTGRGLGRCAGARILGADESVAPLSPDSTGGAEAQSAVLPEDSAILGRGRGKRCGMGRGRAAQNTLEPEFNAGRGCGRGNGGGRGKFRGGR